MGRGRVSDVGCSKAALQQREYFREKRARKKEEELLGKVAAASVLAAPSDQPEVAGKSIVEFRSAVQAMQKMAAEPTEEPAQEEAPAVEEEVHGEALSSDVLGMLEGLRNAGSVGRSVLAEYAEALLDEEEHHRKAINVFKPFRHQVPFFKTSARFCIVLGGNRGGKSLCGAALDAMVVMNRTDLHGRKVPKRGGGRLLITGLDWDHIGNVCYPLLFEPGAFKVKGEDGIAYPVPDPFIPPELIVKSSWESKVKNRPLSIELATGWSIDFKPSSSGWKLFQGRNYHCVHIDEEISEDKVYQEIVRGLTDHGGCLWWSATPLAKTFRLIEIHREAERERLAGVTTPRYFSIRFDLMDNTAIGDDEKQAFIESIPPEMRKVRVHGEFLLLQGLVFWEWDRSIHEVEPFDVPDDWTWYLGVDPGINHPTALVEMAVASAGHYLPDGTVTQRDDMFITRAWKASNRSIRDIAEIVYEWAEKRPYYRIIVDPAASQRNQNDLRGFREIMGQEYGIAMDLPPQQDGIRVSFNAIMAHMKPALQPRECGTPRLRMFSDCSVLRDELQKLRWPDDTKDKDASPRWVPVNDDCAQAWKFLMVAEPRWVDPEEAAYRNLAILKKNKSALDEDEMGNAELLELIRKKATRRSMAETYGFMGVGSGRGV